MAKQLWQSCVGMRRAIESMSCVVCSRHEPVSTILIGVVADSKPPTRARAQRNLQAAAGQGWVFDWGVIAYDDGGAHWADVATTANELRMSLRVYEGGHSHRQQFIGKHVYLYEV